MTLVDPDAVAVTLGLELPLDPAVEARIVQAIEDSTDKVQLYLNRVSLAAVQETVVGLWADETYPLGDVRAWPQMNRRFNDRYKVDTWVVNTDDPELFDVTFLVGLDVANDPELRPILSFIRRDAAEALAADPRFGAVARVVSSVSAGGQSVSYESTRRNAGEPGGALSLESLRKWKRLSIHQSPAEPRMPWPYAYRA